MNFSEGKKMTNEEQIEAIKKYQSCDFVHQLTCGKDNCNGVLEPLITTECINPQVYLKCPKCTYEQWHVPEIVYLMNYDCIEKMIKELKGDNTPIQKFDDRGNRIYLKDVDGLEYWFKWDKNDNMIYYKNSLGVKYYYKYDENNRQMVIDKEEYEEINE